MNKKLIEYLEERIATAKEKIDAFAKSLIDSHFPGHELEWSQTLFENVATHDVAKLALFHVKEGRSIEDVVTMIMSEANNGLRWLPHSSSQQSNITHMERASAALNLAEQLNGRINDWC